MNIVLKRFLELIGPSVVFVGVTWILSSAELQWVNIIGIALLFLVVQAVLCRVQMKLLSEATTFLIFIGVVSAFIISRTLEWGEEVIAKAFVVFYSCVFFMYVILKCKE